MSTDDDIFDIVDNAGQFQHSRLCRHSFLCDKAGVGYKVASIADNECISYISL